jgi:hypothetical protein
MHLPLNETPQMRSLCWLHFLCPWLIWCLWLAPTARTHSWSKVIQSIFTQYIDLWALFDYCTLHHQTWTWHIMLRRKHWRTLWHVHLSDCLQYWRDVWHLVLVQSWHLWSKRDHCTCRLEFLIELCCLERCTVCLRLRYLLWLHYWNDLCTCCLGLWTFVALFPSWKVFPITLKGFMIVSFYKFTDPVFMNPCFLVAWNIRFCFRIIECKSRSKLCSLASNSFSDFLPVHSHIRCVCDINHIFTINT